MKCSDPILRYTTDSGKKIYRNFTLANYIVKKEHDMVFSCGKCLFCRKKKAYELASRCVLHASLYEENCFLTLTYDEKKKDYHNDFQYSDVQKFKKRLRADVKRRTGRTIQIFNVHEYGRNGKKHWHLIVFNWQPEDKDLFTTNSGIPLYTSERLSHLWPHGFSTIGDVSEGSAMYQSQYMEKDFKNSNVSNNKKSHSKHSGIGRDYFLKHFKQILTLGFVPINGKKMPLPRYFEKLAKKHWAHYYDTSYFFDTPYRKKQFSIFKPGEENEEIAKLYIDYKKQKDIKIQELEKNWNDVILQYFETGKQPDFIQAGANALYDLQNKNKKETF